MWILHSRYMLAEGLGLSGIVSILFTGIVSKQIVFYYMVKFFTCRDLKDKCDFCCRL